MAVTLHLDQRAWFSHLGAAWAAYGDLVPVVKGNGYGIGRSRLGVAVDLGADEIAVGTVPELVSVPGDLAVTVLTPALATELGSAAGIGEHGPVALTVASAVHVRQLVDAGFAGSVVVKLATPLRRFGVDPTGLVDLLAAIDRAGLRVHAFGLHFPLASSSTDHARQVAAWLPLVPAGPPLHVSHVAPDDLAQLRRDHPERRLRARVGTDLWHGDKACFRLGADVLDRQTVAAEERVGYRLVAPGAGHLVTVSGGTSHGVQPLAPDGRSPFHFRRTRLALVEPPHMHTSMLFVPAGDPVPEVGTELDLQRPLTQTWPDRIVES